MKQRAASSDCAACSRRWLQGILENSTQIKSAAASHHHQPTHRRTHRRTHRHSGTHTHTHSGSADFKDAAAAAVAPQTPREREGKRQYKSYHSGKSLRRDPSPCCFSLLPVPSPYSLSLLLFPADSSLSPFHYCCLFLRRLLNN